jgi:hypothetical protein
MRPLIHDKVLRQVVEVKNPGQSRYDDQTTANAPPPRNNTGGGANRQIKNQSLQEFGHISSGLTHITGEFLP